jgi:hypothetical protein
MLGLVDNGNFEQGFGPFGVADHWTAFDNNGQAHYVWYEDTWPPVVHSPTHSQLIEISTMSLTASDHDRYAGIYQTVNVPSGGYYTLSFYGMLRVREDDPVLPSNGGIGLPGYLAQWAIVADGNCLRPVSDPAYTNVNFALFPRLSPGAMQYYTTTVNLASGAQTLCIRVWKQWGITQREVDFNVDDVRLEAVGAGAPVPDRKYPWGNFESGFTSWWPGATVGNGWVPFNNDGQATYGYYDDTWPAVLWDGSHSQLIEIDTRGRAASDNDRYSGIYEHVTALTPGKTYHLTIHGKLRSTEPGNSNTNWGYVVQVGIDYSGGTNPWSWAIAWVVLPWENEPYLTPGPMDVYNADIVPSGTSLTLFIRAWKKWPTAGQQMDVNIDGVTLIDPK